MNAGPATKRERQGAIREIIVLQPIASQQELAERLVERGFAATQATVSRDIAHRLPVQVISAVGDLSAVPAVMLENT